MYPSSNKPEFRHAEIALKEFQIASRTIFSGMMRVESQTRALVEAYLSSKPVREVGLTMISQIHTDMETAIPLHDILRNFMMHFYTAGKVSEKVYKHVTDVTPKKKHQQR